jgi:hypothetical protein
VRLSRPLLLLLLLFGAASASSLAALPVEVVSCCTSRALTLRAQQRPGALLSQRSKRTFQMAALSHLFTSRFSVLAPLKPLAATASALRSLLQSPMKSIRKDACWMISNITAGNSGQIQCVLESHLVLPLIEVLSEEDDVDIKKEAAWAITHAMSGGTPEQIKYLVTHGCIPPLCDLLGCHDAEMVTIALTGLEHILHAGLDEAMVKGGANTYAARIAEMGGLFKLENLHSGQHLENLRSWRAQRQLNRLNLRKNPGLGLSCDDSLNGLSNPPMKMTSSLVVDEKNFEKASNMLLTYFGFSSYVSEHPYKEEKEVATSPLRFGTSLRRAAVSPEGRA